MKTTVKPSVVAHACNPTIGRLRQKDREFKTTLRKLSKSESQTKRKRSHDLKLALKL